MENNDYEISTQAERAHLSSNSPSCFDSASTEDLMKLESSTSLDPKVKKNQPITNEAAFDG